MLRRFLLSKIHRAAVTDTNADYEGSLTVDEDLIDAAGMVVGEIVYVFNINNGERIETYLIAGARGSREVVLNGAAAHKGAPGDRLIILTYALTDGSPPNATVIVLDENNNVVSRR
ncbi:MAG: aspartate 1-decarboxylase [Candidatus Coatesbacteria bacterium]|nr:MAG: aspartate 1-decarboxylase [Candidatus Coatesbacteria bacterium]